MVLADFPQTESQRNTKMKKRDRDEGTYKIFTAGQTG